MRSQFDERDLDGELVFDRYLGAGDALDVLQDALVTLAPRWASKLRIWRGPRDQRPIDNRARGALSAAIMAAVSERGQTYQSLVDRHGVPPFDRLAGSVELRGSGPELVVVVSVDAMVVSPLGARQQLGNRIAVQVRRPAVDRSAGETWLQQAFEVFCAKLSPAWGRAGHAGEYWAKVMSDQPRVEAVGRDFGRFLPGVFWLNFYGRRYRELMVLIAIAGSPAAWDTPEYAVSEQQVQDHLGTELFFAKAEPRRVTIAPDWQS
jgi:hypothetical protein